MKQVTVKMVGELIETLVQVAKNHFAKVKKNAEESSGDSWYKRDYERYDYLASKNGEFKIHYEKVCKAKQEIKDIVDNYNADPEVTKKKIMDKYGLTSLDLEKTTIEQVEEMLKNDLATDVIDTVEKMYIWYSKAMTVPIKYVACSDMQTQIDNFVLGLFETKDIENEKIQKIIPSKITRILFYRWCKEFSENYKVKLGMKKDDYVFSVYSSERGRIPILKFETYIWSDKVYREIKYFDFEKAKSKTTELLDMVYSERQAKNKSDNLQKNREELLKKIYSNSVVEKKYNSTGVWNVNHNKGAVWLEIGFNDELNYKINKMIINNPSNELIEKMIK